MHDSFYKKKLFRHIVLSLHHSIARRVSARTHYYSITTSLYHSITPPPQFSILLLRASFFGVKYIPTKKLRRAAPKVGMNEAFGSN